MNLNNSYYAALDENFNEALKLMQQNFTHNELLSLLQNGNIPQKQLAALKLDTVCNKEEAEILINNLTGQDGKIREAVSMKINEFMSNPALLTFFETLYDYNIFLEAIIDINGNICRNIIEAITNLKDNETFCSYFCPKLLEKTRELVNIIKDFNLQDGRYKVNKEIFKLYWCLETIYHFAARTNFEELKQILLITKNINEYTIREKTAKILSLEFNDKDLELAKNKLKQDKNYYVRRF